MAAKPTKRGPTVLVTDSRDPSTRPHHRPSVGQRQQTGLISVDSILQYASGDIPSAQKRGPPDQRPAHTRTPSGRHPLDPRLTGRLLPQHIPSRTSKVSEKLVILPEADQTVNDRDDLKSDDGTAPPTDQQLAQGKHATFRGKTYAETLPKSRRTEKIPRVTAYCTAQGYKMRATAEFLREQHNAKTKLYDADCLYVAYHLPLLPGSDGYRVRSSPVLKSPGGKSLLDEEIERNERFEYREGYFEDADQYTLRLSTSDASKDSSEESPGEVNGVKRSKSPTRIPSNALQFGEMFVFSYGVVVFWNFSERQEKDVLADLTFSSNASGVSLATRPLSDENFETEEFHFQYNPDVPRPRVFNDVLTLRSGDHMIKLSISHAIAQSTKLSYFEERMEKTMLEARHVPKTLALTGRLGMKREEVVKILGKLFMSRVDVNLSSNILDVPNFFWESEPTLHPLYTAVREYLEIKSRIQVLNERCSVFLDLAEILSDAVADKKMTHITWIIIILIIISIFVTCSEVFLRFGLLHGSRENGQHTDPQLSYAAGETIVGGSKSRLSMPSSLRNTARASLVLSWILFGMSVL